MPLLWHAFQAYQPLCDDPKPSPEECLFRAVIGRALEDLSRGCKDAETWICKHDRDFLWVCELAHISPHAVRRLAHNILRLPTSQRPYFRRILSNKGQVV